MIPTPLPTHRTCVFCGATDERFETEEGMEYHFWKSCPMLTRCRDCKQAVEVSGYTEHKLRELVRLRRTRGLDDARDERVDELSGGGRFLRVGGQRKYRRNSERRLCSNWRRS